MPAGIGYTWRQLRDAIDKLPDDKLDGPALVVGDDQQGYDFIAELGLLGRDLLVGPSKSQAHVLFPKGTPALHLQDRIIE